MRRRSFLTLIAATPLASLVTGGDVQSHDLSELGDPNKVGTRAWYIQRLYDNAADGAPICTRDNGALFDYCRQMSQRGLITGSSFFANQRDPITGRDPVTNTEHYIYWWMPLRRSEREIVLAGLKAAAARDASFGRLPTFVQPATRHI